MNGALVVAGTVVALLAALIHVAIFFLESVLWSNPSTWRRFGLSSQQDADVVRPMAFNQGFYNVFLAVGVIVGVLLIGSGNLAQAGFAVVVFALASMLLASLVLVISSPKLARAAATQGVAPLIALVLLLLGVSL